MEKVLKAENIVKVYGKKEVLHSVSLEIQPGVIYGLIGRNGAGKTTLLSILTAQNTHDSGTVTYGGEPVWENERALADICFSRELSPMLMFGENTYKVKDYLRAASIYYPRWDKEYAKRLTERFGLDMKKRISKLSKGMMSTPISCPSRAKEKPAAINSTSRLPSTCSIWNCSPHTMRITKPTKKHAAICDIAAIADSAGSARSTSRRVLPIVRACLAKIGR